MHIYGTGTVHPMDTLWTSLFSLISIESWHTTSWQCIMVADFYSSWTHQVDIITRQHCLHGVCTWVIIHSPFHDQGGLQKLYFKGIYSIVYSYVTFWYQTKSGLTDASVLLYWNSLFGNLLMNCLPCSVELKRLTLYTPCNGAFPLQQTPTVQVINVGPSGIFLWELIDCDNISSFFPKPQQAND